MNECLFQKCNHYLLCTMLMELWVTLPPKSADGLPEAQEFEDTVVLEGISEVTLLLQEQ